MLFMFRKNLTMDGGSLMPANVGIPGLSVDAMRASFKGMK
jgi:uncharacterized membrane protein YphA (DoxX/SURF4 family)